MHAPSVGPVLIIAALFLAGCGGERGSSADTSVAGTTHVCSSCHGPQGRSVNPTFPNLAGQQKDYLVAQLRSFRDHTRADPHAHTYMWGMAAKLTDPLIDGIADFYSSQTPASGTAQDPVLAAAGHKIFEEGVEANGVPACMGCHGEKAEGQATVPRLAGQHRAYLEDQLGAFQANSRANEIMHETSKTLNLQQIHEVTAFLAGQTTP